MEIREYFGLRELPFTREIDSSQRIKIDSIEQTSQELIKTLENRLSAAVIGVAGSGKTALIRSLQERLSPARYRLVYLKLSALNVRELCRSLSIGLGFEARASIALFLRCYDDYITNLNNEQKVHPIIIFDDAQDLKPETLRLIRALTNFQMDSRLLVSVLLVGQQGLKARLLENEYEDIRHRLSYTTELLLLSREESRFYINERIRIAGGKAKKSIFSEGAFASLYERTRGNMRAIDKLALKSMEICAQKKESGEVTGQNVVEGAKTLWM